MPFVIGAILIVIVIKIGASLCGYRQKCLGNSDEERRMYKQREERLQREG